MLHHANKIQHHEASVLNNLIAFPGDIKIKGITESFFSLVRYRRAFAHLESILSDDKKMTTDQIIEAVSLAGKFDKQEIIDADPFGIDHHINNALKWHTIATVAENYTEMDKMTIKELTELIDGLKHHLQPQTVESHDLKSDSQEYEKHVKEQSKKETHGFITSFSLVDNKCPLERNQLVILAARPGVGKTALAMNMAYSMAQYGSKVLVISLEMGPKELLSRVYARISGRPAWEFKYGKVHQIHLDTCRQAIKEMEGTIIVKYVPGADISSIIMHATQTNPDVLILDHIDIMDIKAGKQTDAAAIGVVTSSLKALAGKLNMTVLCLSQFNRQSGTGMPELHQLRGSGAKEQDSDTVLILHRDMEPDTAEEPLLRIAKNRHGSSGIARLRFDGPTMSFDDVP